MSKYLRINFVIAAEPLDRPVTATVFPADVSPDVGRAHGRELSRKLGTRKEYFQSRVGVGSPDKTDAGQDRQIVAIQIDDAEKKGKAFRVGGNRVRQNLDGDLTIECRVDRFPHHSHSTLAQLFEDAIVQQFPPGFDGQRDSSEATEILRHVSRTVGIARRNH